MDDMRHRLRFAIMILGVFLSVFFISETGRCADVLYQNDFSDPETGWPAGEDEKIGKLAYENGYYLVRSNKIWPSMVFGNPGVLLSDIDLEVKATQVIAPTNNNNSYGVLTRYSEEPFGAYAFLISGDGYWAILKIADGNVVDLFYWAFSTAIRPGNDTNLLRVVCSGTYLAFIVNGVVLGEIRDSRFSEGDIALITITYENEPSQIHFDDLMIKAPY